MIPLLYAYFCTMQKKIKDQSAILEKLGITLNPMQEEASLAIHTADESIILSPTGTGKTIAFLLPVLAAIFPENPETQALILVPSRELAIQIEQVLREMGTGYKVNAVYGGRKIAKDREELQHPPTILIGTPGRIADHFRRGTISTRSIHLLVLDEFDKSLEVGFEEEMKEILNALPSVQKKILTSATQGVQVPEFVKLTKPLTVNYLSEDSVKVTVKAIVSPEKDKLETLGKALRHLRGQPGIVFCSFKDAIRRVSDYLTENEIAHDCFHGSMEQRDRERALIKFRNGTHQLLLATDLAARGIDIPEIKFIIHYHIPLKSEEFTHRNGRTARMHREGTAYVLHWEEEDLPDFIPEIATEHITDAPLPDPTPWSTLFVSGGRQDKISKGDIAGLFFKQGKLKKEQIGNIELKSDCAFVAVASDCVDDLIPLVNNTRLKKKKVRIFEV